MKIGLTSPSSDEKYKYYADWLRGDSGHEIVKLAHNDRTRLEECDALVLSGGVDVYPRYYGSSKLDYPNADDFDEARDAFEIIAFQKATQKAIPVLGICRGLQLINCAMGGTLVQDLGQANPVHKGSPDKKHNVSIKEGTLLSRIVPATNGVVNSAHHQAVEKVGEGLRINCLADDGVIEGVEGTAKGQVLLAVQWHPERMFKIGLGESLFTKYLRDWFINVIESRK